MKYAMFIIALFTMLLAGCSEPKPGQYPPSFMDKRDSAPE